VGLCALMAGGRWSSEEVEDEVRTGAWRSGEERGDSGGVSLCVVYEGGDPAGPVGTLSWPLRADMVQVFQRSERRRQGRWVWSKVLCPAEGKKEREREREREGAKGPEAVGNGSGCWQRVWSAVRV